MVYDDKRKKLSNKDDDHGELDEEEEEEEEEDGSEFNANFDEDALERRLQTSARLRRRS